MVVVPLVTLCLLATPPAVDVTGDWGVKVPAQTVKIDGKTLYIKKMAEFRVSPPTSVVVRNEKHIRVAEYTPDRKWGCGDRCYQTIAMECSVPGAVKADSLRLKASPDGPAFILGKDYQVDADWGSAGRLNGGAIGPDTTVWFDYTYTMSRIDSIIMDDAGVVRIVQGDDAVLNVKVPPIPKGEHRLANIWIPGYLTSLSQDFIYPIVESKFQASTGSALAVRKFIPNTWRKIKNGEEVTILAWGDSVTEGDYLQNTACRWQEKFIDKLRSEFPKAKINLITEAWGGRSTGSYLAEPAGSPRNFKDKILDRQPDLVISEFVNDVVGYPTQESTDKMYSTIRDMFKEKGIEWIIMTPHYDTWQHQPSFGDRVQKDTRPHIEALRNFARNNNIALVDVSKRWDHLALEGIPYPTLLLNGINHPCPQGLELYVNALMDAFRK
ncbi:MAG: GDSL-type esterase/lipase family protein [Armatimonadota bacterium]|nr:GDSL-type esterase/lipase family protein [bacterium]